MRTCCSMCKHNAAGVLCLANVAAMACCSGMEDCVAVGSQACGCCVAPTASTLSGKQGTGLKALSTAQLGAQALAAVDTYAWLL